MSGKLMERAHRWSRGRGLSLGTKWVLMTLARYADESGVECFPALSSIMEQGEISKPTVVAAIAELERLGGIARAIGGGRGRSTRYEIRLGGLPTSDAETGKAALPIRHPETGKAALPFTPPSTHLKGKIDRKKRVKPVSQDSGKKTQVEKKERLSPDLPFALQPTEPPAPRPREATADVAARTFAQFWMAYPKRVGKADALKVWTRLLKSGVDPNAILEGVRRAQFQADRQYIKNPSGWLAGRRWEDEPQPVLAAVMLHSVPHDTPAQRRIRERQENLRRMAEEDGPAGHAPGWPLRAVATA